ncbi:LysR family transcriptional regulator [Pseudomonas sp. NPDC089569]|uniref:LysR family transcriptional regulator n=1 Tax=Pseudomonas sp. NPDC089569 TaxID=3390722 RepID=UPI003CFE3C47
MELRHLRHFIGVAEELSFSKAAARLHIEQSPLSRSIKDLESDLGVQLFERTTRSTRLTEAGTIFLHEARQILLAVDKARLCIKNQKHEYCRTTRIAMIESFVQSNATKLFAQYQKTDPKIQLCIFETPEHQVVEALKCGKFDAVISPTNIAIEGFKSTPLWSDSLAIVIPVGHPLSASKEIGIDNLSEYQLIFLKPLSYHFINEHLNLENKKSTMKNLTSERVSSLEMMILLLSSDSRVGVATHSQLLTYNHPKIIIRSMAPNTPKIISYMTTSNQPPEHLKLLFKCLQLI